MVRFSLEILPPDAAIESAVLSLYVTNVWDRTVNQSILLCPLTSAWDASNVTWLVRQGGDVPWNAPGGDYLDAVASVPVSDAAAGAWITFAVPPEIVSNWARDPASNHGWLLKPTADGDPGYKFHWADNVVLASANASDPALRPKLEITYSSTSNVKPLVCVVAPTNRAVAAPGFDLRVKAGAADPDGSVAGVEFFVNGVAAGAAPAAPYECLWRNVPPGRHAITAVATDSAGARTTSEVVTVEAAWTVYEASMDADPGWTLTAPWAFGVPQGGDCYGAHPDPSAGYTGSNVIGYNLDGPYSFTDTTLYAVTPVFDCSAFVSTRLDFWQWLGVGPGANDAVEIEASDDGVTWMRLWRSDPEDSWTMTPGGNWQPVSLDLSALADGKTNVQVRWSMGPLAASYELCGWNLDDVRVTGIRVAKAPDANTNGLGDDWEACYFPGTNANGAADSDGDGAPNLHEFVAGTDPRDPANAPALAIAVSNGTARVRMPTAPPGPFHTGVERTYDLEACGGLAGSWSNVPGFVRRPATGTDLVYTNLTGDPARFFRARIRIE